MYRIVFLIADEKQWYNVMNEARRWFSKNWATQSKIRRKFYSQARRGITSGVPVWFEVPDVKFATWLAIQYSIKVQSIEEHNR